MHFTHEKNPSTFLKTETILNQQINVQLKPDPIPKLTYLCLNHVHSMKTINETDKIQQRKNLTQNPYINNS